MLTDLAQQIVISGISAQGWIVLDDDLQTSAQGWDTMQLVMIKDFGPTVRTRHQVAAEFPIGRRVFAGIDFWVQSAQPAQRGGNVWQVALQCAGRSDPSRPVKFSVTASTSTLRVPASGTATVGAPYFTDGVRTIQGVTGVNFLNAFPGLTASYVLVGQMPPTQNIGRVGTAYQTPPLTLALRPEVVSYINQPDINLPFGWILTSMPYDLLPGTDVPVSLVTESWEYKSLRA
jgi:hypothetical protein